MPGETSEVAVLDKPAHSPSADEVIILDRLESHFQDKPSQEKSNREVSIRDKRARDIEEHLETYSSTYREHSAEQKIRETLVFFKTPGNTKETPSQRIARIYETLELPEDPAERVAFEKALNAHMLYLSEKVFDQHLENPEQYVSHGFDHSMRVADYAEMIIEKFPTILSKIQEEYHISEGEARFALQNLGLLHDTGYCSLAETHNKATHSLSSLRIFAEKDFQRDFGSLIRSKDANLDLLLFDMEGALLMHNADKVERSYSAKILTSKGEFLGLTDEDSIIEVVTHYVELGRTQPRYDWIQPQNIVVNVRSQEAKERIETSLKEAFLARGFSESEVPQVLWYNSENSTPIDEELFYGRDIDIEQGKKKIGLEFHPSNTLNYSLLAVTRIADNLDILPNRLSSFQREPVFMAINKELFEKQVTDEAEKGEIIQRHASSIQDPVLREKIQKFGGFLDAEALKHFGGCEPLVAVSMEPISENEGEAQIKITVNRRIFDELNRYSFKEKVLGPDGIKEMPTTVAQYQIFRLQQALEATLHNGKRIPVKIVDEQGMEVLLAS